MPVSRFGPIVLKPLARKTFNNSEHLKSSVQLFEQALGKTRNPAKLSKVPFMPTLVMRANGFRTKINLKDMHSLDAHGAKALLVKAYNKLTLATSKYI